CIDAAGRGGSRRTFFLSAAGSAFLAAAAHGTGGGISAGSLHYWVFELGASGQAGSRRGAQRTRAQLCPCSARLWRIQELSFATAPHAHDVPGADYTDGGAGSAIHSGGSAAFISRPWHQW